MSDFRTPKERRDQAYEMAKEYVIATIIVVGLVLAAALTVIWMVRP